MGTFLRRGCGSPPSPALSTPDSQGFGPGPVSLLDLAPFDGSKLLTAFLKRSVLLFLPPPSSLFSIICYTLYIPGLNARNLPGPGRDTKQAECPSLHPPGPLCPRRLCTPTLLPPLFPVGRELQPQAGDARWSRGRCDGAGAGAMGPRRSSPVSGGSAAPGGGSLATAPWQRREPRGCARRAGGPGGPRGHPGAGRDPPTPSEPRARERNSNRALPPSHFSSGSGAPAVPPGTRVPGKLRQPCPMHCVAGRSTGRGMGDKVDGTTDTGGTGG